MLKIYIQYSGGVAGHLLRSYNPSLLIQHCIVHRQALAAKDGLQKLPKILHKIVDYVMIFFKNSHVRREKLEALIEMATEEHEYYHLVAYHNVRWLSLNECVQRFTDLLPEIGNTCVHITKILLMFCVNESLYTYISHRLDKTTVCTHL